ncbi:hypothetical protein ZWY2020_032845 [Hordeum vulgare]|nr:hypothetical protein ZWY2020_032845 [Hordeum vulgare]
MKTSMTEIPVCPRERFSSYKTFSRLVPCYKRDWATLLHRCHFCYLLLATNHLTTQSFVTDNFSACKYFLAENHLSDPSAPHWVQHSYLSKGLRLVPYTCGSSCFHTIDRHRFISILKEEIDDSKFFYPTQKKFSAGRLAGGEKGRDSIPNSVLLSALPGNIYLHKLDHEIGRIRQKHEIPLVVKIRSVLLIIGHVYIYIYRLRFQSPQQHSLIAQSSI